MDMLFWCLTKFLIKQHAHFLNADVGKIIDHEWTEHVHTERHTHTVMIKVKNSLLVANFGFIHLIWTCFNDADEIIGFIVFIVLQVEKSKPFKCGTFGASSLQNRHFATGDFDGKLNIW